MKKVFYLLAVVLMFFTLFLTSCDNMGLEEASVRIKFYDSENDKLLFPSSYELNELKEFYSSMVPTKTGYEFKGWYLDKDFVTAFDIDTYTGTEALVNVYAKWEELRKIVTYSGTNPLHTYYYDDLVANKETIADASKEGYKFLGWTLDSSGAQDFSFATFTYPEGTKTVNIFAKYEIITSVSFMNGKNQISKELLSDLKSGTASAPEVEKDGYSFGGWFVDEACTTAFNVATYVPEVSSIKVYAKWEAKPVVYYYDGENLLKSYYLEDAAEESAPTPTKEGYNFVGWVDASSEAFVLNNNATTNQIAYAKWEAKTVVKFMVDDTSISTMYLDQLTSSNLPVGTKDTWTFVNWYTDSSLTTPFDLDSFTTSAKEVKLYAKFIRNTVVKFMNGNELVAERSLAGLKDSSLSNPTVSKEGFLFKGWTLDEAGKNSFVVANYLTDELEVSVYAQWTERETVSYYVDGTLFETKYLYAINNSYVPASPSKAGYDFVGWYVGSEAFVLDVTSSTNLRADAKFEQKVSVKFYKGEELLVTKYLDQLTQDTLPNASKVGYTFKGWFTDSDFNNAFVVEGYPTTIKEVSVYAKFEKVVTVIFMNDSTEVSRSLLSSLRDGTSTIPTVSKAGYVFDGWYVGESAFVLSTFDTLEDEVVVNAEWSEKAKVTYIVDGNVYASEILENINAEYAPVDPSKAGYDFIGWYVDETPFVLDVTSEESLTAVAKFEQKVSVKFYKGEELLVTKYLDQLTQDTLPATSKNGYTFEGWFTDTDFNNEFVVEGYPTTIKEVSVYAKFEKIVSIKFMNGDTEVGSALLSALKEGTSTAPQAQKYGFTFVKWTLDQAGLEDFTVASFVSELDTVNVYAQWTERAKLFFDVDGTIVESKYLFELASYTESSYVPAHNPTKAGFFFKSWAVSRLEGALNATLDATISEGEEDVTVYATWYKNPSIEGLASHEENSSVVVTWTNNENYTYEISLDGGDFESVSTASYTVPSDVSIGKHNVTVRATFLGHTATESIEVIQKIKINLSSSDFAFNKNTRELSWPNAAGTYYYNVKFNNATEWTRCDSPVYVVNNEVLAGSYNFTITIYANVNDTIVGSFEAKTYSVEIVSVERMSSSGLFINEHDQYVLLANGTYSFADYEFIDAGWYTLSSNHKQITVNSDAAGAAYELETITGLKMSVYIENSVSSISAGQNYSYYRNASTSAFNEETNKTGYKELRRAYEIGTSDNKFYLDLDIDGSGSLDTDYVFDLTGKVGSDTDINRYLVLVEINGKFHIEWTSAGKALADGTAIELTIKVHYASIEQQQGTIPSYTFNFITNKGANVYTYAELKEAVESLENSVVNMHKVITINDSDIPATYGSREDDTYNTDANSLICRIDNRAVPQDFRLNGNYFEIDASNIRKAKSQPQAAGPGYTVYWQRPGVLYFGHSGSNPVNTTTISGTEYKYVETACISIDNFRIKGNATFGMSQTIINQGEDAIKAELLKQSGAIDGIILGNDLTANFNNIVIHHCTEAIKFESCNSEQDSKIVYKNNNYFLIEKCSIGDNWANDSFLWTTGRVEYKDSFIYDTSGVSLIIGNNGALSSSKDNAIEYVSGEYEFYNIANIVFNNTKVSNWKIGSEEYFTAYAMASTIASLKAQLNGNVETNTSGQYSIVKVGTDGFEYLNMIIQTQDGGSVDLGTVVSDGNIVWTCIREYETGGAHLPVHSMANTSTPVLFPIGEYSVSIANDITAELTGLGTVAQTTQYELSELANHMDDLEGYIEGTTYLKSLGASHVLEAVQASQAENLVYEAVGNYIATTKYLLSYYVNNGQEAVVSLLGTLGTDASAAGNELILNCGINSFERLMLKLTAELTQLGTDLAGGQMTDFADHYNQTEFVKEAFTQEEVVTQLSTNSSNVGVVALFTAAFKDADASLTSDSQIFVQASIPSTMTGLGCVLTVVCGNYPVNSAE